MTWSVKPFKRYSLIRRGHINSVSVMWTYFLLSLKLFESWPLIMKFPTFSVPNYLNPLLNSSFIDLPYYCPSYFTFWTEIQKSSVNILTCFLLLCVESIIWTCWKKGQYFIFSVWNFDYTCSNLLNNLNYCRRIFLDLFLTSSNSKNIERRVHWSTVYPPHRFSNMYFSVFDASVS